MARPRTGSRSRSPLRRWGDCNMGRLTDLAPARVAGHHCGFSGDTLGTTLVSLAPARVAGHHCGTPVATEGIVWASRTGSRSRSPLRRRRYARTAPATPAAGTGSRSRSPLWRIPHGDPSQGPRSGSHRLPQPVTIAACPARVRLGRVRRLAPAPAASRHCGRIAFAMPGATGCSGARTGSHSRPPLRH